MKKYNRDQALKVVEAGYDQLGELYSKERKRFGNWKEVKEFTSLLPQGAKVLDAGCGPGIPISEYLDKAGFEVIGIDISKNMLSIARENVPGATFKQMNMVSLDFPPESFDGAISCYAIIHNPMETHADIFASFHKILKTGGILLVSVASWEWEEFADYLGVDMFWSHHSPSMSESIIKESGFDIKFGRDVKDGGEQHYWVLAKKS